MKKNAKTIAALQKQVKASNALLAIMKQAQNTISEESREKAEALIAEKESEIEAIKAQIEQLEADETDRTAELEALLKELSQKVETAENTIKNMKVATQKVTNFIESKEAVKKFQEVVANARDAKDFKSKWGAVLAENNITPADLLLPPAVLESLHDLWEQTADDFLSIVDVTGLKAIKVAYDSNTSDSSRAHGHQKGSTKQEQELQFVPKEIRAQIVYKYITLDRETVDFEDENGVLLAFVTRELAGRIMHEIMRAALIGDGREAGDDGKISKIEAIARKESDAYVTSFALEGKETVPTIEDIVPMIASIKAYGDIHLFVSRKTSFALRKFVAAAGGTSQYLSLEDVAAQLGVAEIHTADFLDATISGQASPVAVAFVGKAYKVVGDLTMKGFQDFTLVKNQYEYLTEVYVGGGLAVPNSGAVLYATPA